MTNSRDSRISIPGMAAVVFLTCISLSFAGVVHAGDFSVQIGAFKKAPVDFADAAKEIGSLATSQTREGVTRYRVGQFDSKAAAQVAKDALVGAGYADAFVVRKRVARAMTSRDSARAIRSGAQSATLTRSSETRLQGGTDPLAGLSPSLRSRVVVLDGAYHVKEGDRFVPLSEALALDR